MKNKHFISFLFIVTFFGFDGLKAQTFLENQATYEKAKDAN
jgi:hypothetical protein